MPIFDGVLTVNEDLVPVIIGVEDDGIRMSTNGTEIGEWSPGEFSIDHRGEGVYTITADNESLMFMPNRPDLFAVGLGRPVEIGKLEAVPAAERVVRTPTPGLEANSLNPITRALFYSLAGTTGALGIWALIKLIF